MFPRSIHQTDSQTGEEETVGTPVPELSDEEGEIFARTVDLPGFDDNVSPSNTINTLLRFVVGQLVFFILPAS